MQRKKGSSEGEHTRLGLNCRRVLNPSLDSVFQLLLRVAMSGAGAGDGFVSRGEVVDISFGERMGEREG